MTETPNATIRKFLDLSTGHLPEAVMTDVNGIEGVIAYELEEYGWLVWVPVYVNEWPTDIPRELNVVLRYARERGCDYVLFDRDGPTNADLPKWDW